MSSRKKNKKKLNKENQETYKALSWLSLPNTNVNQNKTYIDNDLGTFRMDQL